MTQELTIQQIDAMRPKEKTDQLKRMLATKIETLEDVLPLAMRGTGEPQRLVNRAAMYFYEKGNVFPILDVIKAIMQAAEVGLAIDGRLAHVVDFGGRAVLNIDYKGLIAVARRSGQIYDIYADTVGMNDQIELYRQDADSFLKHVPGLDSRGETRGAYAIIKFRERVMGKREWRYEYMTREQLDAVKAVAKAQNGPWKTWPDEMRKKTVIRRALKPYTDDPSLARAMELSDAGDGGYTLDVPATTPTASRATSLELGAPRTQALGNTVSEPLDMPTSEKETVSSTPRSKRKEKEAEQQQQDPPEGKGEQNEDAEPPEGEDAKEPETPKLSKRGEVWSKWIDEQGDAQKLEGAFGEVPNEADLSKSDKTTLLAKITAKLKTMKNKP